MESSEIIAIIGAVFAGLVLLMNTWATMQTRSTLSALQVETEKTAQSQDAKLDVIHTSTNSNLELVTRQLAESNARNERLLADAKETVELLASTTAERIQSLETRLVSKDNPVQVQIQQPAENPVPVVFPEEERK